MPLLRAPSRLAVAAALMLGMALAGCGYSPRFSDDASVPCSRATDCPPGFSCTSAGVCRRPGANDAAPGTPDGSSSGDGGSGTDVDAPSIVVDAPSTVDQRPDGDAAVMGADATTGGDAKVDTTTSADGGGCTDACALGDHRCATAGLQSCVMVGGCATWSLAVACPGRQTCQGDAPGARCQCPAPPAGCERGAGSACVAGARKVCQTDTAGCVYDTMTEPCPMGRTCSGSFPNASCDCPAPPAACAGRAGTSCQNAQTLLSCATDAAGCVTAATTITCPAGKPCSETASVATCSCGAAPPDCAGGVGKVCRADGQLVTCAVDPGTGCLVVASTSPCAAGTTCQGAAPGASCRCPVPPPECADGAGTVCQGTGSFLTCVRDTNGCLLGRPATTCPAGKTCTGMAPSAACTCPAPPADCQRGAGTLCNSVGALVRCDNDPTTGCLTVAATTTCPAGMPCGGAFPAASCMCATPPAGCAEGVGRTCSGTNVVTCTRPAGMCFMAATTTCPPGKPCDGRFPAADCTCPPSGCTVAGSTCSGNSLITCAPDANGCLQSSTAPCSAGQYCTGATNNGVCRAPTTVGPAADLGGTGTKAAGALLGRVVTLSSGATLRKFGLISRQMGTNVSIGLYTDVGGNPSVLVAKAEFQAITTAGRNEFAAVAAGGASLSLPAGSYWIMAMYETPTMIAVAPAGGEIESQRFVATGWGALPSPLTMVSPLASQPVANYYLLVTQ